MKLRTAVVGLAAALLAASLWTSGCQRTVKVESGERVVCTYGEIVSDDVKIIEVPESEAGEHGVTVRRVTCDRHARLQGLYDEAQKALAAGDTKKARAVLARIVAVDATYRKAAGQIADIDAGKKPTPDTTTTPGGGPGADDKQPVGPIANLKGWVPDTLTGYTAAPMQADALQIAREYVPANGDVESLVVVVEQYKTVAAADKALTARLRDYPVAASTSKVEGRTVRTGTDGRRFLLAGFTEGGVLVLVEAGSKSRAPAGLKGTVTAVIGELIK